jgi:hypothetical protein
MPALKKSMTYVPNCQTWAINPVHLTNVLGSHAQARRGQFAIDAEVDEIIGCVARI